jgi:hypothetical protein
LVGTDKEGQTLPQVEWSELDPGQAETLLAVLLYSEHPKATRVRTSRGDYGIDVLVPNDSAPRTFDVYQIKYFHQTLTASQKGQVEKSFRRFLLGMIRRGTPIADWYLVMPVDPTLDNQMDWFSAMPDKVIADMFDDERFAQLEKKEPALTAAEKQRISAWRGAEGRVIKWEGKSLCITLAAKYPYVVDYYLHGGREHLGRAIADLVSLIRGAGSPGSEDTGTGALLTPAEAGGHLDTLKSVLDTDPHFLYAFSIDRTAPAIFVVEELIIQQGFSVDRAAPGIIVADDLVAATQEPLSGGWTLTFQIYRRFVEALNERPVPIHLKFATAEATFDTHAYEMWRKYGTPLTAPAEVEADLPGGLGERISGELAEVSLHTPGVTYPARFRIRKPDGSAGTALSFSMTATTGLDGTGVREFGTDETGFLTFEVLTDMETHEGTWNFTRAGIVGAGVVAALPSIGFLQDLYAPNVLQVAERLGPFRDYREIPAERDPTFPDALMDYLGALAMIQQHTATPILIPDLTTVTEGDVRAAAEALALLSGQTVVTSWDGLAMATDASIEHVGPEANIDFASEYQILVMEQLVLNVGEQTLVLGTVAKFALSARYEVDNGNVVARPYRNDTLQKSFSPLPDAAGPVNRRVLGRVIGKIDDLAG